MLQAGIQDKDSQNARLKAQKALQKQKQVEEYKEKKLIIQTTQKEIVKLNNYHLRNQINDRFFQKENIIKLIIVMITKSFIRLLIIIITIPDFTANFLIQKEVVWGELVNKIAKKVEKNIH